MLTIIQISLEAWGAVFCFICAIILSFSRREVNYRNRILMSAVFTESFQLICDVFALSFRGRAGLLPYYMVRISNFSVFFSNFLIGVLLSAYILSLASGVTNKTKLKWMRMPVIVSVSGTVLLIVSQFTNLYYYFDADNFYHRSDLYWVNMLLAFTLIPYGGAMLLKFRNSIHKISRISLAVYLLLPLVTVFVQFFVYGISLTNIANSLTMMLLFIVHESDRSERIIEQEKAIMDQKIEIADARVNLMISQIQPHFISNTLLTIQGMYNEGSDEADEIMNSFIRYLQQSFSELASNKPIPVASDIDHAENYSKIVMARWPDMTIEYDIKCTDFCVPAMTIQPIVENAVRHGILPLEDGGKVIVSTFEGEKSYFVTVTDNGVGFDMNNPEPKRNENRAHIGMSNISDRLRLMCSGTVNIESEKNRGTKITLEIPKS